LIAVIVCAGIWGGSHYVDGVNARIAELEAGIRERGQPLTLDELNAYYPAVPDEENAALVYEEAFALLDAVDPERKQEAAMLASLDELEPGAEIPPELLMEMRSHLADFSGVLEVLDRAARVPHARYPVDFGQGMETEFPHLAYLRSFARLEVIRGMLAAIDSDFEGYVASQKHVLHMADALTAEPATISQLFRVALHSIAAEALVNDLNRTPFPRGTIDELSSLFSSRECSECVSRAVAGEWCQFQSALHDRLAEASEEPEMEVQFMETVLEASGGASVFKLIGRRRYLRILELIEPLTTANDTTWPERLKAADDAKIASEDAGFMDLLAMLFLPSIPSTVNALARDPATLRMMQVVLAVEQYRDATGELPESLEQLVPEYLPEVFTDPFDGQPLRYKRGVAGYKVYSIYFGVDDGGVQWQRATAKADEEDASVAKSKGYGDWVFEVRR
jgi:hypothetical protein